MPPVPKLFGTLLLAAIGASGQQPQISVISHRGEHLSHRENTIAAYQAAIDAGADFIETDVRTTSDGRLVIMHDATVDRCTNGHGEVAQMTFAEIRALDAGGGTVVPSFEEVLELARNRIGVYIDAKRISAADLVSAVAKYGMEDQVVVYGSLELHRGIRRIQPRIRVMPEAVNVETVRAFLAELSPKVVAFDARDFKAEEISVVRDAGAAIFVDRLGAADKQELWLDAIECGASGIQTDHPAELVKLLRQRNLHR